jgi:hypothetical protein
MDNGNSYFEDLRQPDRHGSPEPLLYIYQQQHPQPGICSLVLTETGGQRTFY